MSKPLGQRLFEVKSALEEVEKELAEGSMAAEDLEDFKGVVDHVRLSVWALMTAGWSDEYEGLDSPRAKQVIARFRLQRANDICRSALTDLESGTIPVDSEELGQFRTTVGELAGRLASM
jgi:hypothetical protein